MPDNARHQQYFNHNIDTPQHQDNYHPIQVSLKKKKHRDRHS
ncbi:hypothetical protein B194_1056 [Serratia plymuthica A30]|nr:hypothetical protein B194_1056 [Serratia plymuthica A30]